MPTKVPKPKSTPAESQAYIKFIEESFCEVLAHRHGLKKSILLVLEARFGVLPPWVTQRVNDTKSPKDKKQLLLRAMDASSLGDLFDRGYQHGALL